MATYTDSAAGANGEHESSRGVVVEVLDSNGKATPASVSNPIPVTLEAGSVSIGDVGIADGADVAQGAKADAAYTTGSGSIVSILKGIFTSLSSLVTGTILASGSAIVGKVGIDQTTPGTTNGVTPKSSASISNPTSTLTLTSSTTAYSAGDLIASSATAGSIVVPHFDIANSAGGAIIPRLRLSTNDATSTAWGTQTIQVDLWSAAPTFTNGDNSAWAVATGASTHLATFTGVMSAEGGDGAYSSCTLAIGNAAIIKLASGTAIYWTLQAVTGSGVTGASGVFTLTAEVLN